MTLKSSLQCLLLAFPFIIIGAGCEKEDACDETSPDYTSLGCFLDKQSEPYCKPDEDCYEENYTEKELGTILGISEAQAASLLQSQGLQVETGSNSYLLHALELEHLAMLAK